MFSPCLCGFPPGVSVSFHHQNMHVRDIRLGWPNMVARSVAVPQGLPSTLTSQFRCTVHCIMTVKLLYLTLTFCVDAILYPLLAAVNKLSGTTCTDEACVCKNRSAFWLKKMVKHHVGWQTVAIQQGGQCGRNLFCPSGGCSLRL